MLETLNKWNMTQHQAAHTAPVFKILSYFISVALSGDTKATVDNLAITAKTADFQLSQEESGLSLIIQDVSKDNEVVVQFNLDKVWFSKLWWGKTKEVTGVLWIYWKAHTLSGHERGMRLLYATQSHTVSLYWMLDCNSKVSNSDEQKTSIECSLFHTSCGLIAEFRKTHTDLCTVGGSCDLCDQCLCISGEASPGVSCT